MFIVSQDGKHILNTDYIAEITTSTPAPCVIAKTSINKKVILAAYKAKDRCKLARELSDLIRHMERNETLYIFPDYDPEESEEEA